jgi:hypothetical protein
MTGRQPVANQFIGMARAGPITRWPSNAHHHQAAMISGVNKKCPGGGSGEWHG